MPRRHFEDVIRSHRLIGKCRRRIKIEISMSILILLVSNRYRTDEMMKVLLIPSTEDTSEKRFIETFSFFVP